MCYGEPCQNDPNCAIIWGEGIEWYFHRVGRKGLGRASRQSPCKRFDAFILAWGTYPLGVYLYKCVPAPFILRTWGYYGGLTSWYAPRLMKGLMKGYYGDPQYG